MTEAHRLLHPRGWKEAKGFANGVVAEGRVVFLAGQIGWNAQQKFESSDFIAQTHQALTNIATLVEEAGGKFTNWKGERDIHCPDVIASNGKLHETALAILQGQ